MNKKHHIIERIGLVAIAIAIGLIAFWGGMQWYNASQWNPLGEYPIQVVYPVNNIGEKISPDAIDTIPGSQGVTQTNMVTIYWDQQVGTSGIKCASETESEPVKITSVLSWVSDRPPGQIVDSGKGAGLRGPGCISYNFVNPIPDNVLKVMRDMKEDGQMSSEWHLSGTETPEKDDGTTGVQRTWIATTFRVIHEDAP